MSYQAAGASGTGADPLLGQYWHLNNDGSVIGRAGEDLRAFGAWNVTQGAGVHVSVVDDAVEVVHEDLAANVLLDLSRDYRSRSLGGHYPVPCNPDDSHGTGVAGIIASTRNNGVGGAGVAPDAQLIAYNALSSSLDSDVADALTRQPATNDVSNNSWGSADDGYLHTADPAFIAAIDNGLRNGRGGKGTVYVFPSGNGGCYDRDEAAGLCFPENSNNDGYVNKLGIITACAVTPDGTQPLYGERGANHLVCGPSSDRVGSVHTTALRSTYRSDFSGTSAATPMVSGVAALVLSANPALTWRDVALVLAHSARHNDASDKEWTNAFGLSHNPKYGFGVVDAGAAVTLAKQWTSVGGRNELKTCGPYRQVVNQALPDLASAAAAPTVVSSQIDAADCGIAHIEYVQVVFNARATGYPAQDQPHPSPGDLAVQLVSPAGLVSQLADPHICRDSSGRPASCGDYRDWPFGSVRHLEEPVVSAGSGKWTLSAADAITQDSGVFADWSITFYGR